MSRRGSRSGRWVLQLALLIAAFTLGTTYFGWLSVPVIGMGWGLARGREIFPVATAGLAAGLAWGGWLAVSAVDAPVLELAQKVGAIMGVPGLVLPVATALFASMLAASGTAVTSGGPLRR